MLGIVRFPEAVGDFLCEMFELFVGHDDEDLVGRRLEEQVVAVLLQSVPDGVSCLDGRSPEMLVEAIRE